MAPNIEEAERRIAEAKATGAEVLDLGDLHLRELPASLGGLSHLKALFLGVAKPTVDGGIVWDDRRENAGLTDLGPLSVLSGLQRLDLSSCAGLTDVGPLSGLSGLQRLDLSSCTGLTDVGPLSGLSGLQDLDLWSCIDLTNVSPLSGLLSLQRLNLGYCIDLTDVGPLSGLSGLQSLDLGDCPGLTDVSPLSGLSGLQSLDLRECAGLTDVGPLSSLSGLQSLNLESCPGLTDVGPLSGLSGLQSLNLRFCPGLTDVGPLSSLSGLQSLDLGSCPGLMNVGPLSGLLGLQSLDLWSCPGLTDVGPLSGLSGLQRLDLSSCPGLTDVGPLSGLSGLQSLDLGDCPGLTDVGPLSGLSGLQSLNLSFCTGLTDVGPLSGLSSLQSLNLYGCRLAIPIQILRVFASHPNLTNLKADKAAGVPQEVLSHISYDNCLPRLRTYFSELDFGVEAENELKVILLGNGRVGKTQLCRRFRDQPFDESVESTHGVQIWRKELRIRAGGQEQVFQVNWWDFGGQDIYHGTHALFLRSRAVFLILWTPHLENRNEYTDNGIPMHNQPLSYWLDYVRTLAGEDSPVIVVQSQCDRIADRLPSPPRPEGFGFFESCFFSAKEGAGRETLEGLLRDGMRYLLERNGALAIGQGRAEVRRRLYKWRGEDQKRKPEKRRHRTLTVEEFRALCEKVGGIVSWEHALGYLHHTGVVFYRPDLFSNCIVLDQDWALDAVYTVFRRGETVPLLRDSGRFTRADLAAIVWQKYLPEEQRLFLGLMESCGVCFPCGKTADGETRYVAPDLLPKFEAVKGRLHAWKEEPGTPTLRLEYRFFHQGIIRGLMSQIGQKAGDVAEYWKYGLWFKDGRRDTQFLLQFEDTSTDDAPGAGALELKAQGRGPLSLLRQIRKAVFRQQIGEKPEEFLTLDGTTVARSSLANAIEGKVLDRRNQAVLAAPYVAFFEGREYEPERLMAAGEQPKIDIDPRPLGETEKPREVFISYAWGDDSPEGKVRSEVVDRLCVALAGDGFAPIRDRDTMHPGERISSFIARLTRADRVVTVISDKYLKSPYCMYEIYKVWQRCQGDAEELARHVVPIVLPEVKIEKIRERRVYVDYWKAEKKDVDAMDRKGGMLELSPESFMEARLVREFAHHVDQILVFLRDVLMPRDLKVHFDGDFEAVREALRRRLG